ncbi:unnamed protein product [Prorocentrum cordatum]|uniref:Uncharacterized protein n=1 Tax=Prorocentrum cordatum TaxID=2364126 RepID=A0ABN9S1D1_9DINO|nr:unnamed protein product [Polarella glacialis]
MSAVLLCAARNPTATSEKWRHDFQRKHQLHKRTFGAPRSERKFSCCLLFVEACFKPAAHVEGDQQNPTGDTTLPPGPLARAVCAARPRGLRRRGRRGREQACYRSRRRADNHITGDKKLPPALTGSLCALQLLDH